MLVRKGACGGRDEGDDVPDPPPAKPNGKNVLVLFIHDDLASTMALHEGRISERQQHAEPPAACEERRPRQCQAPIARQTPGAGGRPRYELWHVVGGLLSLFRLKLPNHAPRTLRLLRALVQVLKFPTVLSDDSRVQRFLVRLQQLKTLAGRRRRVQDLLASQQLVLAVRNLAETRAIRLSVRDRNSICSRMLSAVHAQRREFPTLVDAYHRLRTAFATMARKLNGVTIPGLVLTLVQSAHAGRHQQHGSPPVGGSETPGNAGSGDGGGACPSGDGGLG